MRVYCRVFLKSVALWRCASLALNESFFSRIVLFLIVAAEANLQRIARIRWVRVCCGVFLHNVNNICYAVGNSPAYISSIHRKIQ